MSQEENESLCPCCHHAVVRVSHYNKEFVFCKECRYFESKAKHVTSGHMLVHGSKDGLRTLLKETTRRILRLHDSFDSKVSLMFFGLPAMLMSEIALENPDLHARIMLVPRACKPQDVRDLTDMGRSDMRSVPEYRYVFLDEESDLAHPDFIWGFREARRVNVYLNLVTTSDPISRIPEDMHMQCYRSIMTP